MSELVAQSHMPSGPPPGWVQTTLGEIAEVRLGRQRSPKNHSGSRMRPYLRAANVTWDGLDLTDVKEMNFTEAESATYELEPSDILVSEASGSASEVGKPAIWRGEIEGCCFQNTLIRVRTRHASPEFLRYFLLAEARSGRIGNASPGVGIHHIGSSRLATWPVPVPPLNEQRRIVAAIEEHLSRLDAADASLRVAEDRLIAMRQLVVDSISDAGGAPVQVREILSEPLANGRSVVTARNGFPVLRLSALRDGHIDFAETKVGEWTQAEAEPWIVREGEFFVSRGNGSLRLVGRGGLAGPPPRAVAFPDTLIRLRVDKQRVLLPYLRAVWDTSSVRRQVESQARTTAGIYKINQRMIEDFQVPVPPLDEQRRIVAEIEGRLSAIDGLRSAIERAHRRSASLRRAILERAFRGALVPQDPTDEPAERLLASIRAEHAAAETDTRRRPRRRATMRES